MLAVAAVVSISVVDTASIWRPLLFTNDDALLISYAGLLAAAVALLVVSTTPWRYFGDHKFAAELNGYWWDDHPLRGGVLVALLVLALGVGLIFGMAKGIGGNYSYFQAGRHFFETGGDCNRCPSWMISRSTYLTKVRAVGVFESAFFQLAGLLTIYFAVPLRPFADGDVPRWIKYLPEPA